MRLDSPFIMTDTIQLALDSGRACAWRGFGYWYWFSVGAPDGPVDKT